MPMQWPARARGRARRAPRSGRRRPAASPSRLSLTQSRGGDLLHDQRVRAASRRRRARSCARSARRRRARSRKCISTCQRPSGRSKAAQTALGRIEALGQQIGDAARRRFVGGEPGDVGGAGCAGFAWTWSQRFMHGAGGDLPQELSTGYTQAYPDSCDLAVSPDFSPILIHRRTAWIPPTRSPAPKLIQAWGFARDQGRWDDLLDDLPSRRRDRGVVVPRALSGFRRALPAQLRPRQRGQASAVAGARRGERRPRDCRRPTWRSWCARPSRASRSISPPTAASSTGWSAATARWRIVERAALYEKDRLDPVEPSAEFDALMAKCRRREISGAVPLHGLSRARRRPVARRAGALRRPRRDRGAQGALRGVARRKIENAVIAGRRGIRAMTRVRRGSACLLQLILDLVEAGLDAGLVLLAARRAGGAGRADHVVADLDRQRASPGDEAGSVLQRPAADCPSGALPSRPTGCGRCAR